MMPFIATRDKPRIHTSTPRLRILCCSAKPRRPFLSALIAASLLLVHPAAAAGQQQLLEPDQWKRGYHGFVTLCRAANLEIETDLRSWQRRPADQTMLIVIGETTPLQIDVVQYVNRGGAVLIASDRSDSGAFEQLGVRFHAGPQQAFSRSDSFQGLQDCPLITVIDGQHPVNSQVQSIVTNRPGYLTAEEPAERIERLALARFPVLRGQRVVSRNAQIMGPLFAIASQTPSGGKLLCLADSSVFVNQMLIYGDNAILAANSIDWLRAPQRTHVAIMIDRASSEWLDASQVDLLPPPPSRQQILDALNQLPPDKLIEFANTAAVVAEEEGIFNDLAQLLFGSIPNHVFQRLLLVIPTSMLLVLLLTKLYFRRNAVDTERRQVTSGAKRQRRKLRLASERQLAARMMFHNFCGHVAGDTATAASTFIRNLVCRNDRRGTRRLRRQVKKLHRALLTRSARYWTPKRLQRWESEITRWRQLHQAGILACES